MAALEPVLSRIAQSERPLVRLALGLPRSDRPGVPPHLKNELERRLVHRLGLGQHQVQTVARGRPSALMALADRGWMGEPRSIPIVGGVDVLTNGNSLRRLSRAGAIKEEWDGFIPGEAAAFVRVERQPCMGYWHAPASAICGIGAATEHATGSKDDPLIGIGYRDAWRMAAQTAGIGETQVDLRVNDMNGQRALFEDEAMGFSRFFRSPRETALEVWHLGSYFGETGAAAGVLALLWASAALELGFTNAQCVMLNCAEGPYRLALVMRPSNRRHPGAAPSPPVSRVEPAFHGSDVVEVHQVPDPGIHLQGFDDAHGDLVQNSFDALASLLLVREQHHRDPHAPWVDIDSYEARMLAHVDAIGWGRSRAIPKALDWLESEEPEEVAAAALVAAAGVVDLRVAQRLSAVVTGSDDELARITAKYLAAAKPIASTLNVLRSALTPDAPAAQVAIALEGLCSCGALTADVLLELAQMGRAELAPALFEFAARIGAAHLCRPLVELVNRDPSACPPAGLLGYLALMPRGTPLPMYSWRTFVAEAPHAAALHCLLSEASFSASIPTAIEPHPDWIRAMGWCGEVDSLPRLLALLEHDDEDIAQASAMALNMTLAADLYEEVELCDEDDEPEEDPLTVERLTRSPETWQRVIAAVAPTPGTRLRRGRPWTTHSALECLQDPRLSTIDRYWACWEHAIVNKRGFPTQPEHFVDAQRAQLRAVANPSA